jgi:hypothetical protein
MTLASNFFFRNSPIIEVISFNQFELTIFIAKQPVLDQFAKSIVYLLQMRW